MQNTISHTIIILECRRRLSICQNEGNFDIYLRLWAYINTLKCPRLPFKYHISRLGDDEQCQLLEARVAPPINSSFVNKCKC